MRQNFFEVIGMADVERVHSQMLAWVFGSQVLDRTQRSQILSRLVGEVDDYAVNQVTTEYEHIDVLIETASAVIAIENKIKIGEHDDQLARYKNVLDQFTQPKRFLYLSLVPEDISCSGWAVRTYWELHAALLPHVFASPSGFDEHAFNEYVEAVGHLVEVVSAFEKDHRQFQNVFTDGGLTKHGKSSLAPSYTSYQNFVRANQLETALQRRFLLKIRAQILPVNAASWIQETHGIAFLQIVIAERSIRGMAFQWAVQFQGDTAKLNCYARDYVNSTRDQLPAEVLADFRGLANSRDLRGPNLGRTKAYVSLSKKLNFDWSDSFELIAGTHRAAYAELSEIGRTMANARGAGG
jgi:PD-(D/E)XK nuclease superfamily